MRLISLSAAALLGLAVAAAQAATPTPAGATAARPAGHGYCASHAQECKEQAAKFDTWCSANADKCTAIKAAAEHRIEYCSQHEKVCKERHEHRRDRMQGWCDKHPDKPACKNKPKGAGDQPPPG